MGFDGVFPDGVWIFSPDVDATLNNCTTGTKLSPKMASITIPGLTNDTANALNSADAEVADDAQKVLLQAERRSDVQQLDPITLDCQPDGFRILIPLHTSPVTRAEFWNFGNVTRCTSDGSPESRLVIQIEKIHCNNNEIQLLTPRLIA